MAWRRRYNRGVNVIAQRITDFFATQEHIAAVYLFGSVATGTARPGSDVDIAVLFDAPPVRALNGPRFVVEGELETALGERVDLVVLNDAPADLAIRVMRDGLLLNDVDRAKRIAFEVRTRNEAFDLQPMLTLYRAGRSASP